MSNIFNKLILVCLFFITASCSFGKSKGFVANRETFDPFTIYSHHALVVPPIYYISSKEITDRRRYIKQSRDEIQNAIFGGVLSKGTPNSNLVRRETLTNSEQQLLSFFSEVPEGLDIRDTIDREVLSITHKDKSLIRRVLRDKEEALESQAYEYFNNNIK